SNTSHHSTRRLRQVYATARVVRSAGPLRVCFSVDVVAACLLAARAGLVRGGRPLCLCYLCAAAGRERGDPAQDRLAPVGCPSAAMDAAGASDDARRGCPPGPA